MKQLTSTVKSGPRVEWPVVNSWANGTFHGRFWVGLTAVNLARINLNRARARDSHLSAINPFAQRSSHSSPPSSCEYFFRFFYYSTSRPLDACLFYCQREKERRRSVAERLWDASIFATENRNCEEIHRTRYKISVAATSEKKRRLKHETDSLLRDYLPREIIFYMSGSVSLSLFDSRFAPSQL